MIKVIVIIICVFLSIFLSITFLAIYIRYKELIIKNNISNNKKMKLGEDYLLAVEVDKNNIAIGFRMCYILENISNDIKLVRIPSLNNEEYYIEFSKKRNNWVITNKKL